MHGPHAPQGQRGCVVVPFQSPLSLENGGWQVVPHLPLSEDLGGSLVAGHP